MRFKEFKNIQINEINMAPGNLARAVQGINALAGMEFEMVVPNVDVNENPSEPDYDADERPSSIDEICEFFDQGNHNSPETIRRLRRDLESQFNDYETALLQDEWDSYTGRDYLEEWVKNNVSDDEIIAELNLDDDAEVGDEEQEKFIRLISDTHNDFYDNARESFERDNRGNLSEDEFLHNEGYKFMTDVKEAFDLEWPVWSERSSDLRSIEDVALDFSGFIGRPVSWSDQAHSTKREPNKYNVEPDVSISANSLDDGGLEFISPPLALPNLLNDLNKVRLWAQRQSCYTNRSCGLHINVSVPGYDISKLDYVKLALLLGDEYVLNQYGRINSTYARSALQDIRTTVQNNPKTASILLQQAKKHMEDVASKIIHSGETTKYVSINTKDGYVEFRSPGGDWLKILNTKPGMIQSTLMRFVVALDASIKPELYRKEYLKKLYKLLGAKEYQPNDPITLFSQYVSGQISAADLKRLIDSLQFNRKVNKVVTATTPTTPNQNSETQPK